MFVEVAVLAQIRERQSAVQIALRFGKRTIIVVAVELKWFIWTG